MTATKLPVGSQRRSARILQVDIIKHCTPQQGRQDSLEEGQRSGEGEKTASASA